MARWTILFSALISLCVTTGCSTYKQLKPTTSTCQLNNTHRLPQGQYVMQIDIFNKHISGLLLTKEMPDGATRAVFTNEMGFKFFDFEFGKDSAHTVFILPRMDKELIVKTFQNDLGMVVAPRKQGETLQGKDGSVLKSKLDDKDFLYHYVSTNCETLQRIERGGKTKRKVVATIQTDAQGKPAKAEIKHKGFSFKIKLTKVEQEQN